MTGWSDVIVRDATGAVLRVEPALTVMQRANVVAGRKPDDGPRQWNRPNVPRVADGTAVDLPPGYDHGTTRAYTTCGCRCQPCADAKRAQAREAAAERERARRLRDAQQGLPEGDPRHGLYGYNDFRCRCDLCRAAQRAKDRRRREQKRDVPAEAVA